MPRNASNMPSQRQLRVGEEIRHALSDIFLKEGFYTPEGREIMLTISEVRISPDLRNATVFSLPLAGEDKDDIMLHLHELEPRIRHLLSKKIRLKYLPKLIFKEDLSFENAQNIGTLIHQNASLNKPHTDSSN